MRLSSLDPAKILATAERLERRVVERSAGRALAQVAIEAVTPGPRLPRRVEALQHSLLWLRGLVGSVAAAGVAVLLLVISILP